MEEEREAFRGLLGRIDLYLRTTGQEERLHELEMFWAAADQPEAAIAARSFDRLTFFPLGRMHDIEMEPFVVTARRWCHELGLTSLHDQ